MIGVRTLIRGGIVIEISDRSRRRRHFHRLHASRRGERRRSASSRSPRRRDDPSEAIEDGLRHMLAGIGMDAARGRLSRPRHDGRHQHRHRAPRRADGPPDDARAFATCWNSAGRRARRSTTTASRSRRRCAARPRLEVTERIGPDGEILCELDEASLEAAVAALPARAGRERRDLLPAQLSHARARAARAKAVGRAAAAGRLCHRLLGHPAGVPRVRAHVDRRPSTPSSGRAWDAISSGSSDRVRERRHPRRALHDPFQRRPDVHRDRARIARCAPASPGPAAGVVGAAEIGRVAGFPEPHHLRCRRHLDRRVADRRTARRSSPARGSSPAIRSRRRCSTSMSSAPAAARSPPSTMPAR